MCIRDRYENGSAVQSNAVTIGNTAPVGSSVSLSPTSPGTEDELTATASATDADSDTITFSYDWYVNSAYTATTASETLDSSYYVRGDSVYVEATPNDGTDDGAVLTSSSVTVVNTVPTAPALSFNPTAPEQELDDIVLSLIHISEPTRPY